MYLSVTDREPPRGRSRQRRGSPPPSSYQSDQPRHHFRTNTASSTQSMYTSGSDRPPRNSDDNGNTGILSSSPTYSITSTQASSSPLYFAGQDSGNYFPSAEASSSASYKANSPPLSEEETAFWKSILATDIDPSWRSLEDPAFIRRIAAPFRWKVERYRESVSSDQRFVLRGVSDAMLWRMHFKGKYNSSSKRKDSDPGRWADGPQERRFVDDDLLEEGARFGAW